jgi:hypothetical protein
MPSTYTKVEWISAGERQFRALEEQNKLDEKTVMELRDMDPWEFVVQVLLYFQILSFLFRHPEILALYDILSCSFFAGSRLPMHCDYSPG